MGIPLDVFHNMLEGYAREEVELRKRMDIYDQLDVVFRESGVGMSMTYDDFRVARHNQMKNSPREDTFAMAHELARDIVRRRDEYIQKEWRNKHGRGQKYKKGEPMPSMATSASPQPKKDHFMDAASYSMKLMKAQMDMGIAKGFNAAIEKQLGNKTARKVSNKPPPEKTYLQELQEEVDLWLGEG